MIFSLIFGNMNQKLSLYIKLAFDAEFVFLFFALNKYMNSFNFDKNTLRTIGISFFFKLLLSVFLF